MDVFIGCRVEALGPALAQTASLRSTSGSWLKLQCRLWSHKGRDKDRDKGRDMGRDKGRDRVRGKGRAKFRATAASHIHCTPARP